MREAHRLLGLPCEESGHDVPSRLMADHLVELGDSSLDTLKRCPKEPGSGLRTAEAHLLDELDELPGFRDISVRSNDHGKWGSGLVDGVAS